MSDIIHQRLADALDREDTPEVLDQLLNECKDPECSDCSRLICPHGDWFHFHHDGCPACTEAEDAHAPYIKKSDIVYACVCAALILIVTYFVRRIVHG